MGSLSSIKLPNKIWRFLSKRKKYQVFICLTIMLLSAIADLASLTSVLPFLYVVLSKPEKILEIKLFKNLYDYFNFEQPDQLLLPVIIIFILLVCLSGILRTLNLYLNTRLSANIGSEFSSKAYKLLLNKPFYFYQNKNSSEIITSLIKYVEEFIGVIYASLELITGFLTSIFLITGILLVNSSLAIISFIIFGIAYFLLSKVVNPRLKNNSLKIANLQNNQVRIIQESVGSIRNILLDNLQIYFSKSYSQIDHSIRNKMAQNQYLTYFPKNIFESIGLIFIAIISFLYSINFFKNIELIPILAALALGLQRLLPSLQKIYASWATIKSFNEGALRIIKILEDKDSYSFVGDKNKEFNFQKNFIFKDVSFKHLSSKKFTISSLNLEIKKGDKVAVIGPSGVGKSTFLDLLICLFKPNKGKILVDGKDILSNGLIPYWQNIISHVPQEIYLLDASIYENIAIGVSINKIDKKKVERCAKLAMISTFIETLPNKYNTVTGERGAKLSVGQKQRIGLARAFYKNAEVLILDEATSALDAKTEKSVLDVLNKINPKITVIMVTHRINTLDRFDKIIKIDKNNIAYISKGEMT
tara:strand:- start:23471 stop:25234 length:1764 start_codon:yes stop_codon:yes gene_type:complete